jgi:hypothetical protein
MAILENDWIDNSQEIYKQLDNWQDLDCLLRNDSDFFSVYDKVTLHF